MALEIEDGSGKANSVSYVTVVELDAFATARGYALPATEPDKERLLVNAVEFLESQTYKGERKTRAQALQWPRTGVYIDGFYIPDTEIPRELKNSQLQAAIDSQTVNLMPTANAETQGAVVEETVEGAVSVKYAEPKASMGSLVGPEGATLTKLTAYLRPLLKVSGLGHLRVVRG